MKKIAIAIFLLSSLATVAQQIESGSQWYNGALVFTAKPLNNGKIEMNAMAEGEELEFILISEKKEPGRYHIATSPKSGIALYEEGTTALHIQREGLDVLCLYSKAGQLFRVLSKTDEWDCQKLNIEHWMQMVRGSYTMDDGTPVTIDWSKALVNGTYIPIEAITFNGFTTDLIHFDGEGTQLDGDMEVRFTINGLELHEVGFDDYGTWHRLPCDSIILTESNPNQGRYEFINQMMLYGNELYDYDLEALRLMRNSIFAHHGYVFKSRDLQEYFAGEPWYKPCDNNDDIPLSLIEQLNIQLIQNREAKLKAEQ